MPPGTHRAKARTVTGHLDPLGHRLGPVPPTITLDKTADTASFNATGTLVTYSYLVTNTGNVTLNPVVVTDPMSGLSAITCPASMLAPTGTETCHATYTTTLADLNAGSINNTGTATGTPPGEDPSPVSATSSVTIPATQTPALSVTKSSATHSAFIDTLGPGQSPTRYTGHQQRQCEEPERWSA